MKNLRFCSKFASRINQKLKNKREYIVFDPVEIFARKFVPFDPVERWN